MRGVKLQKVREVKEEWKEDVVARGRVRECVNRQIECRYEGNEVIRG